MSHKIFFYSVQKDADTKKIRVVSTVLKVCAHVSDHFNASPTLHRQYSLSFNETHKKNFPWASLKLKHFLVEKKKKF